MELSAKIEALLFFRGEPVGKRELAKMLNVKEPEIEEALEALKNRLRGGGVQIIEVESEVELRTAGEASELIENIRKEELNRDLGRAGAETLAIILYRGPVTRADIDYIRGVNSTFILRNLLVRGLIERIQNPKDQRSFIYKPTLELLSHLGVRTLSELPEYPEVQKELELFVVAAQKSEEEEHADTE